MYSLQINFFLRLHRRDDHCQYCFEMILSNGMKFLGDGSIETAAGEAISTLADVQREKNCWHTIEPITKRRIAGQWLTDIKTARDRQKAENAQHVC